MSFAKKLVVAAGMLAIGAVCAFGEAGWVGNGAIYVDDAWYYANEPLDWGTTPIKKFSGADLGEFEDSIPLGGQIQLWDSPSGVNWGQGTAYLYYSIDGGTAVRHDLTYYKYESNNNFFQSGGNPLVPTNIDVSALASGTTHTLTIHFVDYDNKKPTTPLTANFTVAAPPEGPSVSRSGDTSIKLGASFSLAYSAANFTGTVAWEQTVTPAVAGAAVSPASGNATTFTATPEAAGEYTLKVIATAGGVSATNEATLTVTEPDFGNCWHVPGQFEPWKSATMCSPTNPSAGGDICIFVGNQAYGDGGKPGDMTGGKVYYRGEDETTWQSVDLVDETPEWGDPAWTGGGNNKYWKGIIGPVDAGTMEYCIEVQYLNGGHDTTYLGTADQTNSVPYATAALAQAHPFEVEILQAAGDIYHYPSSRQPWTDAPATYMCDTPDFAAPGTPIPLRLEDRTAEATAAFIEYRIGDGAWTEIEMGELANDGTWAAGYSTNAYWTNCLPGMEEGVSVEYCFKALFPNSTEVGATYLYNAGNWVDCLPTATLDEAEAKASPFILQINPWDAYIGNVWHFPTNYEPWAGAQMREPLAPKESESPYLRVGCKGETNVWGDSSWMTGATIQYRVDGGEWHSLAMGWEEKASQEGKDEYRGNAYWTNALPAASEGALVEYYFATEFTNDFLLRTTYLYSDGDTGCLKSLDETDAQAAPFSYTVGAAPVLGLGNVWHYPQNEEPWTGTTMLFPDPLLAGVDTYVRAGASPKDGNDSMTAGTVWYRVGDGEWTAVDMYGENLDEGDSPFKDSGNAYWAGVIPGEALANGATVQYYIQADFANSATLGTTYVGTTTGEDNVKFRTAAEARSNAFARAVQVNLGNC